MKPDAAGPALDAAVVQEHLAAYFAAAHPGEVTVAGLDIRRAWLDAAKGATVLYALTLTTATQGRHEQQYVGKVVCSENAEEEYRAAVKKAKVQPALGEAVISLPRLRLLLYAFPNDPKLKLFTPAKLQEWLTVNLRRIWREPHGEPSWQVRQAEIESLRYVPGKRFTGRGRATLANTAGGARELRFIVKQLKDEKAARKSYRNLVKLWASWPESAQGTRHPPIRFPRPLAYDARHAAIFLEELPGESLWEVFLRTGDLTLIKQAGGLLAQLHRSKRRVSKRVSRRGEWRENRPVVAALKREFPELRPRLLRCWRAWRAAVTSAREPEVLLHGSFRLNHIFVHQGELALIDLDSLRLGPPAYDVANLISSLYYLEGLGQITDGQRVAITQHLIAGYAEQSPHRIPAEELGWYLISLLINKQMSKLMAHDHAGRREKIGALLKQAEAIWAQSRALPATATMVELTGLLLHGDGIRSPA